MQQEEFSFDVTRQEHNRICEIMDNLHVAYEKRLDAIMDLIFVHKNICDLDLENMAEHAASPDISMKSNVFHDLMGIAAHLDRVNGRLDNFRPRFAKRQ